MCEQMNDTGIEYHTRVAAQMPNIYMIQAHYCKAKPVVHVDYHIDPKLTVFLSLVSPVSFQCEHCQFTANVTDGPKVIEM